MSAAKQNHTKGGNDCVATRLKLTNYGQARTSHACCAEPTYCSMKDLYNGGATMSAAKQNHTKGGDHHERRKAITAHERRKDTQYHDASQPR